MTKDRDVLTFRCSSLSFFYKPYAFPIKQENVLKQKIENLLFQATAHFVVMGSVLNWLRRDFIAWDFFSPRFS